MRTAHLTALRVLESVLRRGTFAAAAEELGVTVAALGQQIRHLEDVPGLQLFTRHPAGARPTAAARAVATDLTTGFDHLDEAMRQFRHALPAARVALSATRGIGEYWLPTRFGALYEALPGVDLGVETSAEVADLHLGEVDLAVRFEPHLGPEFDTVDMIAARMVPLCAPDLARRHDLAPGQRELAGVPLWTVEDPTTDPHWVDWPRWSRETGVTLDAGPLMQRFIGYGTGHRLVRSGLGMMLGGLTESLDAILSGQLVMPLGPGVALATSYRYRLVWSGDRRLASMQRRFVDWFAAGAGAHREAVGAVLGRDPATL